MPLIISLKPKAISKNIATEIRHGKPPAQAAAIAYNVKKAEGGSVSDRISDALMEKRRKKLEADSDYNTSPDLREQSSSLSNSTLFDDLAGSEQGRPDAEEAMYAEGGIAYNANLKENYQDDTSEDHDEASSIAYAEGGDVEASNQDERQSAQDSMRKSFGGKYAKGGGVRIPQARSYVQYGDEMHDKEGNDIPHHDSLPQSDSKEDAFYKPKQIGNQGRQTVDLNMYAPGGRVKMAYGQGRTEEDQEDTPEQKVDEMSTHAYAEGGKVHHAASLEPDDEDTKESKDESSSIALAEGGSVEHAEHLEPDMEDTEESKDESSSIAMAEGGDVAYTDIDEHDKKDIPQEHNEEKYSEPSDDDYGIDKQPSREAYYADGGDVDNQQPPHNPKSHELEKKAKRRKLMIQSLNE